MHNLEILVIPVISLMGLAFAFSSILRYSQNPKFTSVAFGVLFGGSMVMAMTFPISLSDGFIFDLRTLLLGLCVAFAGWRAGLIALGMAIAYRIYLGGGGVTTGIVALVVAYGIAIAWQRYVQPRIKNVPLADASLGLSITGALAALILLPKEVAIMVLTDLAPIMAIANVIGALALGFVFRREMQFFHDSEKLRMHAMIDPLTHLLNRRGTEQAIKNAHHRHGEGRAVFCFDVDHFKQTNDQHGHEAGDVVLSTIVERIGSALRSKVIFSRHGGDEFTLYFPNIESTAVAAIADRLCSTVAQEPVFYAGARMPVTISIGCFWTVRAASYGEMLRRADEQLLTSKNAGRNRATVYIERAEDRCEQAKQMFAYAQ